MSTPEGTNEVAADPKLIFGAGAPHSEVLTSFERVLKSRDEPNPIDVGMHHETAEALVGFSVVEAAGSASGFSRKLLAHHEDIGVSTLTSVVRRFKELHLTRETVKDMSGSAGRPTMKIAATDKLRAFSDHVHEWANIVDVRQIRERLAEVRGKRTSMLDAFTFMGTAGRIALGLEVREPDPIPDKLRNPQYKGMLPPTEPAQ